MADPSEHLNRFGSIVNFFSSPKPFFSLTNRFWHPPTDIYECSDAIVIKMEVGGLCPESLSITAQDRKLIVRGKRSEDRNEEIVSYHFMEIQYGEFERVFEFPFNIETEQVKASHEKGFLSIKIPKSASVCVKVPIRVIEGHGP